MKKRIVLAIIAIILVSALVVSTKYPTNSEITVHAEGPTSVGGILWDNTTWTLANSPYTITSTVQIPENVTLTIEPGVTISKPTSGDLFLINGIIIAKGNTTFKITFDGGSNSNFFNPINSGADAFLDLEYCIVKNGNAFWPPTGYGGSGHFNLRYSELSNLGSHSHIWYPEHDIFIEYNVFNNTAGFSIVHSKANVTIRSNLFIEKNSDYVIRNYASYDSSRTIVTYNSFINMEGVVLELPPGYSSAAMDAEYNYWGTDDTNVIDSMIYDKNDDITCAGFIDYLPILSAPHPDTPIIPDLPSNILMLLIVMVLSVGALVFRKKLLKPQNQILPY